MNRYILLTLLCVFLLGLVYLSYNIIKNSDQIEVNAYTAIPQNASIIIDVNKFPQNWKNIEANNMIWSQFKKSKTLNEADSLIQLFLENIETFGLIKRQLENSKTSISFHGKSNNYHLLFNIPLSSKTDLTQFKDELDKLSNNALKSRSFNNEEIFSYTLSNKKSVYFNYSNSIFSLSFNQSLIESAIKTKLKEQHSVFEEQGFAEVIKTKGKGKQANIFFNTKNMFNFFDPLWNEQFGKSLTFIKKSKNWGALDLSVTPSSFNFLGYIQFPDSTSSFFNLLKNQLPGEKDIFNVLPSSTDFLMALKLNDADNYFKKLSTYNFSENKTLGQKIKEIDQSKGTDIYTELYSWIADEMGSFNFNKHNYFAVKTKDKTLAVELLSNLVSKTNDSIQSGNINLPDFSSFFGPQFLTLKNPFFKPYQDFVFFAESSESLDKLLLELENNRTLANDKKFKNYLENITTSSNLTIYYKIPENKEQYHKLFNEKLAESLVNNFETVKQFEAICLNFSFTANNLILTNLFFNYNPVYKEKTKALWEKQFDTTLINKPFIVINHNTQSKEIVVQDLGHNIYLISNTGNILWKKKIRGSIKSKIYQVDKFKNKKLQMIFNTDSAIYLIDRNGNDINGFPIYFKSPPSNTLSVMDYERNKNYRLLIATENKELLNYDIEGKMVKGWEYSPTPSKVISPVYHHIIANKDYIVMNDIDGNIKIIQRNGKDRLNLTNKLPENSYNTYFNSSNSLQNTYLIGIDSLGVLYKLTLTDKLETDVLYNFDSKPFLIIENVDNDINKEYIFIHKNSCLIYDDDKSLKYNFEFKSPVKYYNGSITYNSKRVFSFTTSDENIHVIDGEGIEQGEFPLPGNSPVCIDDLNNDNKPEVIAIFGKKLINYQIAP